MIETLNVNVTKTYSLKGSFGDDEMLSTSADLVKIAAVPMPRTTIPDSPSKSKH